MIHQPVNKDSQESGNTDRPGNLILGSKNTPSLTTWLDEIAPAINEGIVMINSSQCIVYFNAGAEKITAWKQNDVLGKSIYEIFNFHEFTPFFGNLRIEALKNCQAEVQHREGFPVPVNFWMSHPPQQSPVDALSLIVFHDIREQDATKNLQAFFLANITHEFRTPLSSLNASVEFLLEEIKYLSKNEIVTLLTSVHLSVTGLQMLIDNLLESIQIEAGRFNISPRTSELEKIIAEASRIMSPLLSRRQQILKTIKPAALPQIHCDPIRITQVLVNLLSNASKYGPTQQEIVLEVQSVDDHWLKVTVADRGPGIPVFERGKIFQQYYRLGSKSSAQDGVGLGLWVVRVIIEQHGGVVGVQEAPGGGSIFWFTIPITG